MSIQTTNLQQSSIVDELLGNYDGSTVRISFLRFLALVLMLQGPSYATLAELEADLDWPAGAQGYVTADSEPGNSGRYRKDGAMAAGSWTRVGDLPSGAIEAAELALKAPIASPDFTGIPLVDTAAPGTNTRQAASTAFVQAAITALIGGAPGALDTLNELAAALADDADFAATIIAQLGLKAPLASAPLTGTPTAPTAAPGTNTTQLANTAFVTAAVDQEAEMRAASDEDTNARTAPVQGYPWQELAVGTPDGVTAYSAAITDDAGNAVALVETDGTWLLQALRLLSGLTGLGFLMGMDAIAEDFALADAEGNIALALKGGALYAPGSPKGELSYISADRRNKGFSARVRARPPQVQLPTATYNIIVVYGQSLAEGAETWPSLSKTPAPGALMIGDNVDNLVEHTFNAMGDDVFNPLVAYTRSGGANLDGAGEAALAPGSTNFGEPPVIGLTNGLKRWLNDRALMANDGRYLVALSPGTGGRTIEQLSKVNTQDATNRWNALTACVGMAVTLADADTACWPVMAWLQGEWDYLEDYGSVNATRVLYGAALETLLDDANDDAVTLTGQTLPPLKVIYQTGGSYSRDVDGEGAPGLHVGMAQIDVALDRLNDTVMAGPVYPYTDKGGHLDSNAARWFGHQMAKITRRVWSGEGWQPLRPIEITRSGRVLIVHYHVPHPPLVFDTPYVIATATSYADKGFRVTTASAAIAIPIVDVEIVGDTVIRITCASDVPADALLWYADKTMHNGNGNLRDSDSTLASDTYEYVPERGMYASANIPALVGNPYPLHNWCVAFCLPVTYSEF